MSKKTDLLGPIPRALVGVPREYLGVILDVANKLGGQDGKLWKVRLTGVLREGVKPEVVAQSVIGNSKFLKRLFTDETIVLDPTDGTKTIAQAKEVFTGYLSLDFINWGLDMPGQPTPAAEVFVCEMVRDGTFRQIFGSLNCPFDQLCLTQHQIRGFVVKHRDKLREDGYGTFFLFKVRDEFFVADVRMDSGGRLYADVYRFSDGIVWSAESRHRFVFPQLIPLATVAS
jgi:hypothetical protein